jgi:hypothetical protein
MTEKRTEIRDGKLYTVTVLPSVPPPRRRSRKTRYKMEDVGKAGDVRSAPARKRKYATFAEGFAARAADEQKRLDLHAGIAKTMRGEPRR